jgi:hypothetical protein
MVKNYKISFESKIRNMNLPKRKFLKSIKEDILLAFHNAKNIKIEVIGE